MMIEPEFNLLDEPWILAADGNGKETAVSLKTALVNAHELIALSGELPTQDVAVMRLLLGILHAILSRTDETGKPHSGKRNDADGYALWKRLWDLKRFPEGLIVNYLERYRDRFFLFHEGRPFYQVAGINKGTRYAASKLIGDMSESENKIRLFQNRSGGGKKALSYAEAVRWLLYLNAYDDTSAKPTKDKDRAEKLPSVGAGWLGKLGLVYAVGGNLFETLMLNLTLLNDNEELWDEGFATWELDKPRTGERTKIGMPKSQAALLTLQSRRLLLERTGGKVTSFILLGGDFFDKENAFAEQMTLWRYDKKEKVFTPKRHNSSRQLWRDFSALFIRNEAARIPGIVTWLSNLEYEGLINSNQVRLRASSVQYGDKDFFVNDLLDDSVSVNANLLNSINNSAGGETWLIRINHALELTEKFISTLGYLAVDLAEASGESYNNSDGSKGRKTAYRDKAKEPAYFDLDMPFREWLTSINPTEDDLEEKMDEWKELSFQIVHGLGERMFSDAGIVAFVGKKAENGMNSTRAFIKFENTLQKIKKGSEAQ